MNVYYDLHIHTALSPCADNEMRPAAIAKNAKQNGLDIISVVDHVCGKNILAAQKAAENAGLLFLPGVEATSNSGAHLLCYFKDAQYAYEFSELIYSALKDGSRHYFHYGDQFIVDENDHIVGEAEKPLSGTTPYSTWEIIGMVTENGGVVVPAHINRPFNGILQLENEQFKDYNFSAVEVKQLFPMDYGIIKKTKVIYNSDAHRLDSIAGQDYSMALEEKSIDAVLDFLSN